MGMLLSKHRMICHSEKKWDTVGQWDISTNFARKMSHFFKMDQFVSHCSGPRKSEENQRLEVCKNGNVPLGPKNQIHPLYRKCVCA